MATESSNYQGIMRDIRKELLPAYICGYSFVAVIHLFGLLLLRRVKFQPTNQRIVIINLAFAELFLNLHQFIVHIFLMMDRCDIHTLCDLVDKFFYLFLGNANKLIMIYLIIDRLLDVHLHIRYPLYFTEQRVTYIMLAIWLLCFIYAILVIILIRFKIGNRQAITWFVLLFHIGIDTVIVLSALITYIFLYMKVRHFRAIDISQRRAGKNNDIKVSNKTKFLLPCLIIATYLVFNNTANVMFLHKYFFMEAGHAKSLISEISHWFWILGHLSDGVLYIFLQKDIRKRLVAIFKKRRIESVPATSEISVQCPRN